MKKRHWIMYIYNLLIIPVLTLPYNIAVTTWLYKVLNTGKSKGHISQLDRFSVLILCILIVIALYLTFCNTKLIEDRQKKLEYYSICTILIILSGIAFLVFNVGLYK